MYHPDLATLLFVLDVIPSPVDSIDVTNPDLRPGLHREISRLRRTFSTGYEALW